MNVPNLDAFGNPRSADHRAAAKYASEMIDSIATQLKINIVTAAQRGDSFDQTERSVRNAVFQLGKQALELFIQLQGDGDLGPEVTTENAKVLRRSETTTRTTIRSIFSMHCFDQFTYAPSAKKATQLLPISARMLLPKRQWSYLLQEFSQTMKMHLTFSARTVPILDLLHALAYVWEAAGLFKKDDKPRKAFTRERLLRILRGDVQGVISGLRRMGTRVHSQFASHFSL
ncbi:hypothetical protein SH449x_000273 [Pirellulaceae bacterium SH449]